MRSKRPSVVQMAVECSEGEREDTPYQWVIEDGDVIADGQEASGPCLVVCACFQQIEEAG